MSDNYQMQKNGWQECKLGQHVLINSRSIDKNYPFKEIEYLDTGSITRGKIESLQCLTLAVAPSRAKRIVKDNDIILSMVRPIQRHYGYLSNTKPNSVVSTGFVVLTGKDSIDPYFLYSFLTQDEITEYLDIIAEGSTSTYPAFTPDVIENLSIFLPTLPEQRAIAGVLSSLDDKIDLLHRQNKTLEGMAEALWRKMFVVEADEEWKEEIGSLSIEIIDGDRGVNYPKNTEFNSNGYCLFLSAQNVTSKGFNFSECSFITKEKDEILRSGKLARNDIVLTTRGTVGNIAFYHDLIPFENIRINSGMVLFRAKNLDLPALYLFISMKTSIFSQLIEEHISGSAQPQLPIRDIKKMRIINPPKHILNEFIKEAKPIHDKFFFNENHIRTLSRLRDTLLPKLMSGEMRIRS